MVFAYDILPAKETVKLPKKEYSPFVGDHFPNRVLFGDTHLHTSWSTDAGMVGATLGPDAAYRVSRGETVTSHQGWKVKLIRPLDFLVVADHAENLGLADFIRRSDPIRDIIITYLRITFDDGKGILGCFLDITDRKEAEKEIREKYDELNASCGLRLAVS
jgi:hypothetical protein